MFSMPVLETGIPGIRYDFVSGLRIAADEDAGFHEVEIYDMDNSVLVWKGELRPAMRIATKKKYKVSWGFTIRSEGQGECVTMSYSPAGRVIEFDISSSAMGDAIAWFAAVPAFVHRTGCRARVVMQPQYIELFADSYPDIEFVTPETEREAPYARYEMGCWRSDTGRVHCPYDYRSVGMLGIGQYILGLPEPPAAPHINTVERDKDTPYVAIASKGSSVHKCWCNPLGWANLNSWLKANGYRVVCIDRDRVYGTKGTWISFPPYAEDLTGQWSLRDRANTIANADFFIGGPSGLSWLAWCCGVPIVLISGFSSPWTEPITPYRVTNVNVCHGCWEDSDSNGAFTDILACPKHNGDACQYECSRAITARGVAQVIKQIPAAQKHFAELGSIVSLPAEDKSMSIMELVMTGNQVDIN